MEGFELSYVIGDMLTLSVTIRCEVTCISTFTAQSIHVKPGQS
jgi:hypothetical protein